MSARKGPMIGGDRRRTWLVIGLVLFVVLDIVLVAWAFASIRRQAPVAPGPIPTFTSVPTGTPASS